MLVIFHIFNKFHNHMKVGALQNKNILVLMYHFLQVLKMIGCDITHFLYCFLLWYHMVMKLLNTKYVTFALNCVNA